MNIDLITRAAEYAAGHPKETIASIASRFGVTAESVSVCMHLQGRGRGRHTGGTARDSTVKAAEYAKHHPEKTIEECADVFGVCKKTVGSYMQRHGFGRGKRGNSGGSRSENVTKAVQYAIENPGESLASVGRVFGVSGTAIAYRLKRDGLMELRNREADEST